MAYHELSITLWNKAVGRVESIKEHDRWKMEDFDSTIRKFLSEKAKALKDSLNSYYPERGWYVSEIDERLGLSVEEPMHKWNNEKKEWTCECCKPQPSSSKEWCEHISKQHYGYYFVQPGHGTSLMAQDNWMFCPICGTPRPKKKSLAEKFRECGSRSQRNTMKETTDLYQELAELAEAHFKQV